MNTIKAIIFDCFGVIYPDTLSLVERPYVKDKPEAKKLVRDLRRQADAGLLNRDEFWTGVAKIFGISLDQLNDDLRKIQHADWELLDYIKSLRSSYKTAMLSNVGHGFVESIFSTERPQADYFDEIVISAEIGVTKPDPDAYLAVAHKLSIDTNQAIFVDDIDVNVLGAKSVGMMAIHYQDIDQFKRELDQILSSS